ncbi:MAG: serine/threonine protein kinase, partial [Acidobacteria bacterium]
MTVAAGDCLGRYEVLGSIGAGGMGEVWRARDNELEREVAVKVLPDDMAANPERIERFQREAKALAAISHPNLLEIYDVGSSDDIHYVVTEFLEGQSLGQYMRGSELSWEKAAEIGAAVADG